MHGLSHVRGRKIDDEPLALAQIGVADPTPSLQNLFSQKILNKAPFEFKVHETAQSIGPL